MKSLKKFTKLMLVAVFAMVTVLSSVLNVNAANETIQLGSAGKTGAYIGGFNFQYKVTTDGKPLYCLNYHKKTAQNVTADVIKNSGNIDGGVVYIIKNGYPTKSITGDNDKDYYITQVAVWWYLDETRGTSNITNNVKSTGSDNYGVRGYIQNLVNEAKNHKNDSMNAQDATLKLSTSNTEMKLDGKYFVSNDIKVSSNTSATVTLEGAPKDTIIERNNGTIDYNGAFTVNANETFKVKVPATQVSETELNVKVVASAKGTTGYTAYEIVPKNSSMQNCAMLVTTTGKDASDSLTLGISSSKITVTKIDSVTKQPIAGAVLVLKDSNGKEITRWTSDINAHVVKNLPNGDYTITEEQAPNGYLINKKDTKFTITDTNRNIKITIEDAPKKVVVNINKVDQETNKPLAGAVLVVKKADGTEVVRFTTSEQSYTLTDIENGTYTVEEISAPAGYIKSNEKITFTIDDEHLSHQITFVNAKEVWVPDTGSVSSVIMIILGIAITGLGLRFIYKNGKKA